MAFNYEAPHTRYYENDLTELIRLYKQLLSEYDEILETSRKLQEEYEKLPETVQTLVDESVADLTARINRELEALRSEVEQTVAQVRRDTEALEQRINDNMSVLTARVNRNYQELTANIQSVDANSIARDNDLQNQIDELRFTLPDIYNPVAGRQTSIQQAVLDLYGLLATNPITAAEYDAKQLTANAYDVKRITAFDYDTKAAILL